jgi:hypothetical protein
VWPPFRPNDYVRVRSSGRVGEVSQIEPNERGDDWLFEIAFEPDAQAVPRPGLLIADADVATYRANELELVEASGQEHDEEIELALDVSDSDAKVIASEVQRLIAETFVVERARRVDAGDLRIGISPRAHPREAVRALMAQLGTAWLVEDDGWYANVTWVDEIFPVAGVHGAQIFLRPWREPRQGERLPRELAD